MKPARAIWAVVALSTLSLMIATVGCEEQKTVHVKRGSAMLGLEGDVGDEKVLEDGTRVIVVGDLPSTKKSATVHDGYAIRTHPVEKDEQRLSIRRRPRDECRLTSSAVIRLPSLI